MTETLPPPDRIDVLTLEMRALGAEVRAGFAENRIALVELETRLTSRIDAVDAKVETVIDAVAEFRAEHNGHTHE